MIIVPILAVRVDRMAPERASCDVETLLQGRMLHCPWCHKWAPLESYTALQTPPLHLNQCPPVYKHGGEGGCRGVFSLFQKA